MNYPKRSTEDTTFVNTNPTRDLRQDIMERAWEANDGVDYLRPEQPDVEYDGRWAKDQKRPNSHGEMTPGGREEPPGEEPNGGGR